MKNIIDNLESYICRILLISFMTILFFQVVSREIFSYSISWSEELAVYLFVWFVFFGASRAVQLDMHNRIDFQFKYLPSKVAFLFKVLSEVCWLIFNLFFLYISYDFVFNKMNLFWKSQTIGIPMKFVYFIMPVVFLFITLRHIQININKIKNNSFLNVDDT